MTIIKVLKISVITLLTIAIFVGGSISLYSIYVYLFAPQIQYQRFSEKALPDTLWVDKTFSIYFLSYKGTKLFIIDITGVNLRCVFKSKDPIQEYQFSPNGEYLHIRATKEAHLLNTENNQLEILDYKGTIQWAPDSQRFTYISGNSFYVYNHLTKEKLECIYKEMHWWEPNISWGLDGKNLYFSESKEISKYVYNRKIFRIPISTMKAELVAEVTDDINIRHKKDYWERVLEPLKIELFDNKKNKFERGSRQFHSQTSEKGEKIYQYGTSLWYEDSNGHKRKLFYIPGDNLKGGRDIHSFRWIQGGRYVIMQSSKEIFILEPSTGKISKLVDGNTFGWYLPPSAEK